MDLNDAINTIIVGKCTIEFECTKDEYLRHVKEKKDGESWKFTPTKKC